QPLMDLGEAGANFRCFQAKEVDHHHAARGAGDVSTVEVGADVINQPRNSSPAKLLCLIWGHDETRPVQFHAWTADTAVRRELHRGAEVHATAKVGVDDAPSLLELDIALVLIAGPLENHFEK